MLPDTTEQTRRADKRPLTDAQIRNAKPGAKARKLFDGGGLYVLITPAGNKPWKFKYRFDGKEKLLSFGSYPDVRLSEAREQREDAKRHLRASRDPSVAKEQEEVAQRFAAAHTFESVAREWFDVNKGAWPPTHAYDVLHSLERDVFLELGGVAIRDIGAPLVLRTLRKIEARPAIETACRVRQRVSAVFRYGVASGVCTDDPAATVAAALKPVVKGRQPAVTSLDEARQVLRDAEAMPAHPVTKLGLRLLALTAVRPGTL